VTGGRLVLIVASVLVFALIAFLPRMDPSEFTTNAEDQAEAAKLKARLANPSASGNNKNFKPLGPVDIADGKHKYVLISAQEPGFTDEHFFVTSKRGAGYHRNAAEPFVHHLEEHGYEKIQVIGGGRILLDTDAKNISIFGFSYGFGKADHEISKRVVQADQRYADYDITTSDEGY
jgi:phosphohistidine phosphatase